MVTTVLQQKEAIKEVINSNFTFADLSPRFKNVDDSSGNIFCPFHENRETPAAKMYWDEDKNIWIIHCFGECHRNFTAYDYVNLVLCLKYQKYASPLAFLQNNMSPYDLKNQLKLYERALFEESDSQFQEKIEYVDEIFDKYGNITNAIEDLYTR